MTSTGRIRRRRDRARARGGRPGRGADPDGRRRRHRPGAGAHLGLAAPAAPEGVADVTSDTTLRIERTFRAPAQKVFEAWTSEEVMRRWWHAEREWETPEASVDLRVGGAVRVVMRNPRTGAEYGGGGRYTEIDPPRRLAFTWLWDDNATRTLIELDLEEHDGVTTVRFTHSD